MVDLLVEVYLYLNSNIEIHKFSNRFNRVLTVEYLNSNIEIHK